MYSYVARYATNRSQGENSENVRLLFLFHKPWFVQSLLPLIALCLSIFCPSTWISAGAGHALNLSSVLHQKLLYFGGDGVKDAQAVRLRQGLAQIVLVNFWRTSWSADEHQETTVYGTMMRTSEFTVLLLRTRGKWLAIYLMEQDHQHIAPGTNLLSLKPEF
jgi:hypothetical protein